MRHTYMIEVSAPHVYREPGSPAGGPVRSGRAAPRKVATVAWLALAASFAAGCAARSVPPDAPGTAPEPPPAREEPRPPGVEPAPPGGAACALIFSTNDTHGRLLPAVQSWSDDRPVGGMAALAARVEAERRATPECPLFVVSGGDIMQGTVVSNLTDGRATIEAMNAVGYDAAAIGNHEFDWGIDVLVDRIEDADFPLLSGNIYLTESPADHPAWARPWTIVERDGVRVGFIGGTTTTTPLVARPSNVASLEFRPLAETLERYVPIVREQGADFVVALFHEGAFCRERAPSRADAGAGAGAAGAEAEEGPAAVSCEGPALEALATAARRVDYAVTGHTHSRVDTEVAGVPVIQSFANTTAYGLGRLDRSSTGEVSARTLGIRQVWADEVTPEPAVERLIERHLAGVRDISERVVITLPEALPAPRNGDFPLGRIVVDAQREASGADIALMNNGGIRRSLPAGPVTYSDLFELQPFANEIVRHTMSGALLLEVLEHSVGSGSIDLHVSGAVVRYDPQAPGGARILGVTLDGGAPLRPDGVYTVAANNFIADGGGGYVAFLESELIEPLGVEDLETLVNYLEARSGRLDIPLTPRWITP